MKFLPFAVALASFPVTDAFVPLRRATPEVSAKSSTLRMSGAAGQTDASMNGLLSKLESSTNSMKSAASTAASKASTTSPVPSDPGFKLELPTQQLENALRAVADQLDSLNVQLSSTYKSSLTTVLDQVKQLMGTEQSVQTELAGWATKFSSSIEQALSTSASPQALDIYHTIMSKVQLLSGTQNQPIALVFSAIVSYSVLSSVLSLGQGPPPARPYPNQRYDPDAARAYFDDKLPQAIARALDIAINSLAFGVSLLKDKADGTWDQNEEKRGMELAQLLTKLGPTFIKIGQSLSIRTDILSPAYIRGLTSLQDQVPAFDTKTAKEILEDEWGAPIYSKLQSIGDKPIAAASLGQVYRATMKDGRDVAIKVQRPNIMNQIALDMHLLREFAPIAKRTFNLNTDTTGTVDAWGLGFVDELDYTQEAQNGKLFMEKIQDTPLKDVVFSPEIVDELSTSRVLTTEWIDGERLDRSSNEDITVLCSICMNTYLTMLLELGLLHCDPHPGNLLRTPEGKLCILDWGMVTRLPSELQLTLIEHVAHLVSADYAEVPRDLLLLGFIPEDKADLIADSGVVEVLADIYGAWTSGGGVASVNVNDVINRLQDLTAEKGNLFQIPPYFAYIAKSFSVLEGIGLSNDSKYSIVSECLPYVSQRLLTDKESMGSALNGFIFGPEKNNFDSRIIDIDRVEDLVSGFGSYSTSASGALLGKEEQSRTQVLESLSDTVLNIVISEEETPVQEILIEQLAKIVTSSSRSIFTQLRERSGTLPTGRTVLGTVIDPLGLFRTSPLVRMNEQDEKIVETTRRLLSLIQSQASESPSLDLSSLSRDEVVEFSSILVRKVWSRRIGLLRTGNRFATKLLQLTADKLERGERDTRKLPDYAATSVEENTISASEPPEKSASDDQEKVTGTRRLEAARNRLDALTELESDALDTVAQEAVPVKNTL